MKPNEQLTTAYIKDEIYEAFKIESIKYKITIRNLVERSAHLFVTDPDFRRKILNQINLEFPKK